MAAFGIGAQGAGFALLAATLPMLVLPPPVGSRMVRQAGWRRAFGSALGLITIGNAILTATALAGSPAGALVRHDRHRRGAALAHSQLTGAIVALAPSGAAGMASLTMVARQGGFALGVAALGVLAPTSPGGAGYAATFAFAATAGLIGLCACGALPGGADRPR